MKPIFYCILFVLCGYNTFAQESEKVSYVLDNEELPATYLEFRELEAKKYIDLLKGGALLVKINSEQRKIDLYRKNGNNAIASTLIKKRDSETRRLMKAFKEYYDFSPVYFFFSHDVKKLKLGLKSGFFLNENLEVDNSIELQESEYLIFDRVIPREEDIPVMYLDNAWGRREDESKRNKNKKAHGTDVFTHSSSGVATYVIKNAAFEQLRPPFPVYTMRKILRGLPYEVDLFNARFHRVFGDTEYKKELESKILSNKMSFKKKKRKKK